MPLKFDFDDEDAKFAFFDALIDRLERKEQRLLTWGVVDAGFSKNEVEQELFDLMDAWEISADSNEMLDALQDDGILIRASDLSYEAWRTRSAETIRLTAKLRQLFPSKQDPAGAWLTSPKLIADFRYTRRARVYPIRDIPSSEFLSSLEPGTSVRSKAVMGALLDAANIKLAGFQARGIRAVLDGVKAAHSGAAVITAGTGSGKTIAFYAPTLAHIAAIQTKHYWTKCVALYPRKELLRDQLRETLIACRNTDDTLATDGIRPITIGAYYGDTPWDAQNVERMWERIGQGYLCPFVNCTWCNGKLIWRDEDRRGAQHQLHCHSCNNRISAKQLLLTRKQMAETPPDILFTTTEMLNQKMADTSHGHIFGLGTQRKPPLMLLDEVHTYDGTSGAQVGMLIRRWRSRVGHNVFVVGLSATLKDAAQFFSQLTGVPSSRVIHIEPSTDEMVQEGAEYMLALRSDPHSGTSVLSATIQTAMVLTRCLNRHGSSHSTGPKLFGSRTFVFTDALDVTNRLFFDLRDAEGTDSWGRATKPSLAALRNPVVDPSRQRRRAGQSWDLPLMLGHGLGPADRLRVGRTSSQDAGVDAVSDIIVATAALEVGFNDSSIGAVVQHKAPRAPAAFLQRKGRAGRVRGMRPWTVVVLSDYGRDREAYQAYDALFDPELPIRHLPIANQHVQRMHGVQCFFEWAAMRIRPQPRISLWKELASPAGDTRFGEPKALLHNQVADLIDQILEDGQLQADLRSFLRDSLQITDANADELLWQGPRSILLEALPTLSRRLRTGWQIATPDKINKGTDLFTPNVPLSDYIAPQLFSPLTLPEVIVAVPPQTRRDSATFESMPVLQALREFAPGRVSRRFGINNTYNRHWIPVLPNETGEVEVNVDLYFDSEQLSSTPSIADSGSVALLRPHSIKTEKVPSNVRDSSNSFLKWRTTFSPIGEALELLVPRGRWQSVLDLQGYLHSARAGVLMTRIAYGAEGELRFDNGDSTRYTMRFVRHDGRSAALGAEFMVDAIKATVKIPDFGEKTFSDRAHQGFREYYLRSMFQDDAELSKLASKFRRLWLYDATVAVLALRTHKTQSDANLWVFSEEELGKELANVYAIMAMDGTDLDVLQDASLGQTDIAELVRDPAVLFQIIDILKRFQGASEVEHQKLLRSRFLTGVGGSLLAALRATCSEYSPEEITCDIMADDSSLWITETSVGGAGFIENAFRRIADDPRHFSRLLDSTLDPQSLEIVDNELSGIIRTLAGDDLAPQFDAVRTARSNSEAFTALESLKTKLRHCGVRVSYAVVAALASRILRPGTSKEADTIVSNLLTEWERIQNLLQFEVGIRALAYAVCDSTDIDDLVGALPAQGDKRHWRMDAVQSALWERGWSSKSRGLEINNMYDTRPESDKDLLDAMLIDPMHTYDVTDPSWLKNARLQLASEGTTRISGTSAGSLATAIGVLTVEPIDVGFLSHFPTVSAVRSRQGKLIGEILLRDVVQ